MNKSESNQLLPLYPGIISFGVTFIRIILAFSCIPLLEIRYFKFLITGVIVIIMVLDQYDGKMFKLSSLSAIPFWRKMRRILDSCGDRICIQLVCIPLLFTDFKFIFPYLIICFKEAMTSIICIKEFRRGVIVYPSKISKISTIFVGLTAIAMAYNSVVFTGLTSAILLLTGIQSCLSYQDIIKKLNAGGLTEGKDFEHI